MTTTAIATKEKPPISLEGGLVKLNTLDEAYRFAQNIVHSGLAPYGVDTPEKVLIAMQHGAELGLKPLQSLNHICVIHGKPAIYGKAAAALVVSHPQLEIFEEWFEGEEGDKAADFPDDFTAVCKVKRRNIGQPRVERFTVRDAKRAGLWMKKSSKGDSAWVTHPKDMLRYKARARALVLFADILIGLPMYEDLVGVDIPQARAPITEEAPHQGPRDPLAEDLGLKLDPEKEVKPGPKKKPKKNEDPELRTSDSEDKPAKTLMELVAEVNTAETKDDVMRIYASRPNSMSQEDSDLLHQAGLERMETINR